MHFFIRLIFTLIALISISNPVFAKNMGEIYKVCKSYQSKGFQLKEIGDVECLVFFRGIISMSHTQCEKSKILYKLWTEEPEGSAKTDYFYKSFILAENSSSANLKEINSVITSFINNTEKIPQLWDNPATLAIDQWLFQQWKCKNIK